jgi:molybdopterin synthase sulfur carrier subunit
MMIRIRAFARFREVLGDELCIDVPEGSTVTEVLGLLCDGRDEVRTLLFDGDGALREYVILMKNRERIPLARASAANVGEGDELVLFPPVAGG